MKTAKITRTALAAAAIFAATFLIKAPVPGTHGGYINFGDAAIYLAAYLLGGPSAAAAAAIGSAAADMSAGAALYAPATFVIKGLTGLTAGFTRGLPSRAPGRRRFAAVSALAGGIMVAGYALYEFAIFGAGYALAALPMNAIQWAGCVAAASVVYPAVSRLELTVK